MSGVCRYLGSLLRASDEPTSEADCVYLTVEWDERTIRKIATTEGDPSSNSLCFKSEIFARLYFTNLRVQTEDPTEQAESYLEVTATNASEFLGKLTRRTSEPCFVKDPHLPVEIYLKYMVDPSPSSANHFKKTQKTLLLASGGGHNGSQVTITLVGMPNKEVTFKSKVNPCPDEQQLARRSLYRRVPASPMNDCAIM